MINYLYWNKVAMDETELPRSLSFGQVLDISGQERVNSTRSISDIEEEEEEEIICKKLCRSKIVKPLFLGITFQATSFTLSYRPTPLTIIMSNSLPHQRLNIWHDHTSKRIYLSSAWNDYIAFSPFQQIHMYPYPNSHRTKCVESSELAVPTN